MERIDLCKLCCEGFSDKIRPRVLPCGHSYCTGCLDKLIKNGDLSCPNCKRVHRFVRARDVPVNYDLEESLSYARLGQAQIANPGQYSTRTAQLQTLVSEQKNSSTILLNTADNMQSQLVEYDEFLLKEKTKHEEVLQNIQDMAKLHTVLLKEINDERNKIKDAQKEGDVSGKEVAEKLPQLENAMSNRATLVVVADLDEGSTELEKWIERCRLFPYPKVAISHQAVTEAMDALSLVLSKEEENVSVVSDLCGDNLTILEKVVKLGYYITLTLDSLRNIPRHWKNEIAAGRVYAIQCNKGRNRCAVLSEKDNRIYLHHLKVQEVPTMARTIQYNEVMKLMNTNSTVAFMDLFWGGSLKGRVHILLSPDTPLARNFRMLCTGQSGPSYAHSIFHKVCHKNTSNEGLRGGDYDHGDGTGGAPVMNGMNKMADVYTRPGEAGIIYSSPHTTERQGAQFTITTGIGKSHRTNGVFGDVIKDGLAVLRAAAAVKNIKEVEIRDCGVVLPL